MGTPLSQSTLAVTPSTANTFEVVLDDTRVVFVSSRVLLGTGVARCGGNRCFGDVKVVRKSPGRKASNVKLNSPECDCS
jgi:hypothetical protein